MINWSDLSIGSIIETDWNANGGRCGQSVVYRINKGCVWSIFEREYNGMDTNDITDSEIDWLIEVGVINKKSDVNSRLWASTNQHILAIVGHIYDNKGGIVYD